jgi:hypothetical protein
VTGGVPGGPPDHRRLLLREAPHPFFSLTRRLEPGSEEWDLGRRGGLGGAGLIWGQEGGRRRRAL